VRLDTVEMDEDDEILPDFKPRSTAGASG
jgi:hypothetical protein